MPRHWWRPGTRRDPDVTTQLEQLGSAVAELSRLIEGQHAWLVDLQSGANDAVRLGTAVRGQAERMDTLERWIASCVQQINQVGELPLPNTSSSTVRTDPAAMARRHLQVWTVMAAIALDEVPADAKVSVILPTWNRPTYLQGAIASVLAQTYPHFELLVVVRGGDDVSAETAASFDDPRVRVLQVWKPGAAAACNVALDAAQGELIAYLSDDNVMHPGWLRSVAWAFQRWPDTEMVYGARILQDPGALRGAASGELPLLDFPAYTHRRLERANFIDQNAVAHRAEIAEGRYDETLTAAIDWDFILRVAARQDPRPLPAVACFYRTVVSGRISDDPDRPTAIRNVRARALARRGLRVLVYSEMFPVISETYIREEAEAIQTAGATISFAALRDAVSRQPDDRADRVPLEDAMRDFDPDVVLMPWATHANVEKDRVAAYDRPFAVWVHGFDFDPELIRRLAAHSHCLGVWAFPHHAAQIPGAHPLLPVLGPATLAKLPNRDTHRDDLVVVVSAGLGKKDWETVMVAFDQLPEVERLVIVGRTIDFETLPEELEARVNELAHPFELRVNVSREEVLKELSRAAALLYTLEPGRTFGMPMSIIEGMLAGTSVVAPDRDEVRALVGGHLRAYRTTEDIVGHVRAVVAGGPAVERERRELRARAERLFTGPETGRGFYAELLAAYRQWLAGETA
jgi:glycosyltransferase involved in cell wall biosynthesis